MAELHDCDSCGLFDSCNRPEKRRGDGCPEWTEVSPAHRLLRTYCGKKSIIYTHIETHTKSELEEDEEEYYDKEGWRSEF